MDNKKCALYLRVSKSDQTTLNQELELKGYCQRNDWDIFNVYKDEGVSGSKTSRPELDKMLKDVRDKKFEAVIVWKFDRLGRSTAHLLQVLEEMKNKGIRLIATSQSIDTDTAMGKFFFTILSGFAEMERGIITERINLGLARVKKQGKKLGRPSGSKDKSYRKKSGYLLRWQNQQNLKVSI
ncbi:MAG: hypothetical protein A2599_02805 [Candidatus Staskawiczbacteria bacterium RIFOXYD1_FULL_39_28]|uniref:Resolvase/invertase-type recombinase catalytic domain-containing protein n=1 Tax=Candidatus Staskawiczbacteria bacterium RIFOXYC1_FULL_38_18 TaxID=1802229 RepID=A0A1G2JCC3_9BACT|nr:MAG: hypothetical protein A2401_01305 [Candidatus Staskawiczbacteria bacterium RIFOXYC1_FULL_38_18]OGZ91040.1 MAG: hypothetical protein A2599_02805 [Candidatus Staskawiczbacteria bacterium RIFOXYD1_FULL_39_28]